MILMLLTFHYCSLNSFELLFPSLKHFPPICVCAIYYATIFSSFLQCYLTFFLTAISFFFLFTIVIKLKDSLQSFSPLHDEQHYIYIKVKVIYRWFHITDSFILGVNRCAMFSSLHGFWVLPLINYMF